MEIRLRQTFFKVVNFRVYLSGFKNGTFKNGTVMFLQFLTEEYGMLFGARVIWKSAFH